MLENWGVLFSMPKRLTQEEFIRRAKEAHGDRYDYSKVEYVNNSTKVCIICSIHGEFLQRPYEHIAGHGCDACGGTAKLDTEAFIKKAKKVHGDKYDYSNVKYVNSATKVQIVCPTHGFFEQMPYSHLNGNGCPGCGGNTRIDTDVFIKKSKSIHGDKYDYSLVKYTGIFNLVKIKCPIHGTFEQKAGLHLRGYGCKKCSGVEKKNTDLFIEQSKIIHGDRYSYHNVQYINNHTRVCITCPEHGNFWQLPTSHLSGKGCKKCANTINGFRKRLTNAQFIERAMAVHGGKYNYSNVDYTTSSSYVTIICPKHGPFRQSAYNHMNGQGCPHCKKSRGELRIKEWLDAHDILYISEYRIPIEQVLFGRNNVRVDFWLPCHNIVIEYNGIQHYERQPDWQSIDEFQEQQDRDKRVREYCNNNGLNLIEIPYTKYEDIPNILHQNILNNRRR